MEIKEREDDVCSYCNKRDTLKHYFISCRKLDQIWLFFSNWWDRVIQLGHIDHNDYEKIITGVNTQTDSGKATNLVVLLVKYYIFLEKCKEDKTKSTFCLLNLLKFIKHKLTLLCTKTKTVHTVNPVLELILEKVKISLTEDTNK